ncbi:glycosyltransferase [Verrucomicrobia bacterium]|nr:glycosyltransferase [Verrucomicrobiota bacterium]
MKILVLDYRDTISENNIYKYYGDIFRELNNLCELVVVNTSRFYSSVNEIIGSHNNIDCILFSLGYFTQADKRAYQKIDGLDKVDIPVVCMVHKLQTLRKNKIEFCKINKVDLVIDSHSTYKNFREVGIRSLRLPFSATPRFFYPRNVEKKYDLGFCGALHDNGKIKGAAQDIRSRIYSILTKSDFNIYWRGQNVPGDRIASIEEYASNINKSKIWISTTGPIDDMGPRYFEVALSKTLLFCNKMPETYEKYFEDGVNCITFKNDLSDFEEKLNYYLTNSDEREEIANKAFSLAINNYTWKHMAIKLLKEVEIESRKRYNYT